MFNYKYKSLPKGALSLCIVVLAVSFCSLFSSCTSSKKLRYFNNLSDSQLIRLPDLQRPEPVVMTDDILNIKITGANEVTVGIINGYTGAVGSNAGNNYQVDAKGMIEFPVLGKVNVTGFTRDELKIRLTTAVAKYLKDPIVTVSFTNFRFTVLGEVNAPGTFVVTNEKVTILEGLGLARDMTQYARRSNIRIIRDSSGTRHIGLVNFNDKSIFSSPYYYLQRNDVVYVEPEGNKGQIDQANRVGAIIATLVSIIAVSLTIFR